MVEEKIWQKSNIMNLNLTPILKSVITPQTYIQQYINSITGVDLKPQGVCALLHDATWLILDTEHALDGFQDVSEYF